MNHLDLITQFIISGIVIWIAGIWLARSVDAIDTKYKIGSAFGGLLILGIATSLPEIAVTVSAALDHHYGIIIGTLLGGIAMQTLLLCFMDMRMPLKLPLSFAAASLTLVLEATLVILVVAASITAAHTPAVIPHTSISLSSVLILAIWLFGLWLAYKAQANLPWRAEAIKAVPGRPKQVRHLVINHPPLRHASALQLFSIFGVSAGLTLVAGYVIQSSGSSLADAYGISGGLFGATFIAFATALPNLSTGFASIRLGDNLLAMSDIFGGNAFLPPLFLVADIISGHAVLTHATPTDIWFAALGILLTSVYVIGLIVRPRRQYLRMGLDSLAVLVLYVSGVVVLAVGGG